MSTDNVQKGQKELELISVSLAKASASPPRGSASPESDAQFIGGNAVREAMQAYLQSIPEIVKAAVENARVPFLAELQAMKTHHATVQAANEAAHEPFKGAVEESFSLPARSCVL